MQFGSLITYGLGHIKSSTFEPYQVGSVVLLHETVHPNAFADYLLVLRSDHGCHFSANLVRNFPYLLSLMITDKSLESLYMPDSPVQSKFLSKEDKLVAIERYLVC